MPAVNKRFLLVIVSWLLFFTLTACIDLADESDTNTGLDTQSSQTLSDEASAEDCSQNPPTDYNYIPGQSYFGNNNWIEYIAGDLPIIISAPHGGELTPEEVPIYNDGLAQDGGSQDYARATAQALYEQTGKHPHLIINHLMRNRLNLNRAQEDDNFNNPLAMQAWNEFHSFVSQAKAWVSQVCGKGAYFDFHTNGHEHGYNELGFLLSRDELNLEQAQLNLLAVDSSIKNLASDSPQPFWDILYGPYSLGNIMHDQYELLTIPNARDLPFAHDYFTGGFNTQTHGSRDGGEVDGIQIESHWRYVNNGESTRLDYSQKLARSIKAYIQYWYGFTLEP